MRKSNFGALSYSCFASPPSSLSMERSRRAAAGRRSVPLDALAALKAARGGVGVTSRSAQIELRNDGDVYDELDETAYAALVEARRQAEFVVDDGGLRL